MDLNLKKIATIDSCYRDRFAVPRQSLLVSKAESIIVFENWIQPELALQGLSEFSHIWVIFGFHLNKEGRYHAKVHPPRLNGETMGALATRSPHRPNPIGLSLVQISKVNTNNLEILGGDFANGTPVYDIKPYLPETESQPFANGGWLKKAQNNLLEIEFENQTVESILEDWAKQINKPFLKDIIIQTLERDPRPLVYKKIDGNYKDKHAFRLFNGDIHFYIQGNKVVIFQILIS